jgi:hypothetical protein
MTQKLQINTQTRAATKLEASITTDTGPTEWVAEDQPAKTTAPNGTVKTSYFGKSMRQQRRAKRAQSATGAREARPQKRKLRAKHDHSRGRMQANDEESSITALKSENFSGGRASRAALRAPRSQRVGNSFAAHVLPVGRRREEVKRFEAVKRMMRSANRLQKHMNMNTKHAAFRREPCSLGLSLTRTKLSPTCQGCPFVEPRASSVIACAGRSAAPSAHANEEGWTCLPLACGWLAALARRRRVPPAARRDRMARGPSIRARGRRCPDAGQAGGRHRR